MKQCKDCGVFLPQEVEVCQCGCDEFFVFDKRICPHCGKINPSTATSCELCGTEFTIDDFIPINKPEEPRMQRKAPAPTPPPVPQINNQQVARISEAEIERIREEEAKRIRDEEIERIRAELDAENAGELDRFKQEEMERLRQEEVKRIRDEEIDRIRQEEFERIRAQQEMDEQSKKEEVFVEKKPTYTVDMTIISIIIALLAIASIFTFLDPAFYSFEYPSGTNYTGSTIDISGFVILASLFGGTITYAMNIILDLSLVPGILILLSLIALVGMIIISFAYMRQHIVSEIEKPTARRIMLVLAIIVLVSSAAIYLLPLFNLEFLTGDSTGTMSPGITPLIFMIVAALMLLVVVLFYKPHELEEGLINFLRQNLAERRARKQEQLLLTGGSGVKRSKSTKLVKYRPAGLEVKQDKKKKKKEKKEKPVKVKVEKTPKVKPVKPPKVKPPKGK